MANIKQLAIDALEGVIDGLEKQLEKAKAELEKLKGSGEVHTDGGGDPVPPDPTHPKG